MALLNGAKAKRSTYDFILTEWPSNNSLPLWYTNINGGANDQQFSEMLKHFGKEWSNMTSLQKEACHFEYSHRKVSLILPNKNDHIQNIIKYNKTFYEVGMLEDARSRVPANGVVLDIGANIGNHSIYFGLFSDASKVFLSSLITKLFKC
ncbi:hypothetical protein [Halomonas sp. E19]|uniref:hypothetical protein n=1 Tax=Halomonas sp. E19 TaxID=3397247 RepID=UPI0040344B4F